MKYSLLCAADGNMSLRRFEKVGTADNSSFESDYFVSREFVNRFANVVQAREKSGKDPTTVEEEHLQDADVEDSADVEGGLDDTGGALPRVVDPLGDTFEGLVSDCVERWKANADDDKKTMWDCFDECGVFLTICRHGIVLLACDIVKSGEL